MGDNPSLLSNLKLKQQERTIREDKMIPLSVPTSESPPRRPLNLNLQQQNFSSHEDVSRIFMWQEVERIEKIQNRRSLFEER